MKVDLPLPPSFPSGRLSLVIVALAVLSSTSGCLSHRIRVRATDDDGALARTQAAVLVVVRPLAESGDRTPAALEHDALRMRLENALFDRGYPFGEIASHFALEAVPKIETVSRRSWTSDTDATAPRLVPGTDLVFVLRAVEPHGDRQVWWCEARLPLPVNELPGLTPDTDALWNDLVERALAKIPAHRAR